MKQLHLLATCALAMSLAIPTYCMEEVPLYENGINEDQARHDAVASLIRGNPFKRAGNIFKYIDSLNVKAREHKGLRFKELHYEELCLDHANKTSLCIYYSLGGRDELHPIIFHFIDHERDPRTIKLDLANVMTIDDNRQLREVESVIKWSRIPESLKVWASQWSNITPGEYVSIVPKPLQQENLVLFPPDYLDAETWPRPAGNRLNQFYEYSSQYTDRSNYIYMNRHGECYQTRVATAHFYALNQPDLTQLNGSLKNSMAYYCGEAVIPINRKNERFVAFQKVEITGLLRDFSTIVEDDSPSAGKTTKLGTMHYTFGSSIKFNVVIDCTPKVRVLKPYWIQDKGFHLIHHGELANGFYSHQQDIDVEDGVLQSWVKEPASSNGLLQIRLTGVRVNGAWRAPLAVRLNLVPRDAEGSWTLDLSPIAREMTPADFQELKVYLRSAYLMGINSPVIEYFPERMSLSDKGFFREDPAHVPIVDRAEVDPHHLRSMEIYWESLQKLVKSMEGMEWLKFDFAAGLLLKEGHGADRLTEVQRSQLFSKLVEIKQIHLPYVKLSPIRTLVENRNTLTHVDLTGVSCLREHSLDFVSALRSLSQLKFLSIIKSDFRSSQLVELTNTLSSLKMLTELKIPMPYSTLSAFPRTITAPLTFFEKIWDEFDGIEKFYCITGTPFILPIALLQSLKGARQDAAAVLYGDPCFSLAYGDDFVLSYKDLLQLPQLERMTLDIGGYNQDSYNWLTSSFISDHKTLHKKPKDAAPVQIQFMMKG